MSAGAEKRSTLRVSSPSCLVARSIVRERTRPFLSSISMRTVARSLFTSALPAVHLAEDAVGVGGGRRRGLRQGDGREQQDREEREGVAEAEHGSGAGV